MTFNILNDEDKLTIFIEGEIDHHNCKQIRESADLKIIELKPKNIYLNFKGVSFMDSSGIGLIMGRFKTASSYGGSVFVADASSYIKRVMRLAGLDKIVTFCDTEEETK